MKHILRKILTLSLALALLCALAPAAVADDIPATGVELSSGGEALASATLGLVSGGEINNTVTLTATVKPVNATVRTVTWTVVQSETDPAVSTEISGNTITITGLKKGTATVTAAADGGEKDKDGKALVKASCTINVTDPVAVTGVTLSASTLKLVSDGKINNTATLTATVAPSNATDKRVEWNIFPETAADAGCVVPYVDPEAEPDESGLTASFQGKRAGKATIVVTAANGKTAECAVTVIDPVDVEDMTLSRTTMSLVAGATGSLTAAVKPSDATDQTVTWEVATGEGNIRLSPAVEGSEGKRAETQASRGVTIIARRSGTARVTATINTANGQKYSTSCDVTIDTAQLSASLTDGKLEFDSSGLLGRLRTYCENITDASLSYLSNISVSTSEGTLYDGYVSEADHGEGVSSAKKYYNASTGTNQLRNLVFVPRIGFSGNATISFTAYSTANDVFTGSIVVYVEGNSLSYTSEDAMPVRFQAADFTAYSQGRGYNAIKYVRFDLPASYYGTLYYNYIDSDINEGKVSASTLYYRTGYPYLDKVWFVPNAGYSGNVTISFEAWDTSGERFTGSLMVQVVNVGGSDTVSTLSYSVRPGGTIWLSTNDFNSISYDRTDYPLDYIRFTSLPTSSRGTLYYSGYGAVNTSQYFYRAGSSQRLVSDLYFTAASTYTGSATLRFTARSTNGRSFSGTVSITISTTAGATNVSPGQGTFYDTSSMIVYSSSGEAVTFRSQDFYSDAAWRLSNSLSTVHFYKPDAAQGRLCLNYRSPTSYTVLDESVGYPYTTVSQISFLPRAGFSGAVYIRFIATDTSGKSYTGTMAVNVAPPAASRYFDDMGGYSWAAPAADFLANYRIVNGTGNRAFSPAGLTKRGDFILMLQRGFDLQSFENVAVFGDVPTWSYYGPAIAGAYVAGVVAGDGDGNFRPDDPLTRQEAAVLLYRCLRSSGSLPSVTTADLAEFVDRDWIAPYAQTAVATLVRLGVLTGSGGYLNPTQDLTRAEMALMVYRALT